MHVRLPLAAVSALAVALAFLLPASASAREGQPDPAFGPEGVLALDAPVTGARLLPDDRILTWRLEQERSVVAVRRPNGSLDPAFGEGGTATIVIPASGNAAADVDGEGRVLFSGSGTTREGDEVTVLVRLTPAGRIDTSYGENGLSRLGFVTSERAIAPDGSAYFGRSHTGDGAGVVRVDPVGRLDPSFGTDGVARVPGFPAKELQLSRLSVEAERLTVVAWRFGAGAVLARLDLAGRPDLAFGSFSLAERALDGWSVVAVQPDRAVLLRHQRENGVEGQLARLRPDGQLDGGFGMGGLATIRRRGPDVNPAFDSTVLGPDGRIYVVNLFGPVSVVSREGVASTGYGDCGWGGMPNQHALGVDRRGRLLLGIAFGRTSQIEGLASLQGPDGGPDSPSPRGGVGAWVVTDAGVVRDTGLACHHGDLQGVGLQRPVVGIAGTPSGRGYWLVAADGGIFTFGDAGFFGSMGNLRLRHPVVGMAPTPSGRGYWLVASDGGVFTFGDAGFFGSRGAQRLAAPVVDMARTNSGRGYWLVAADGGVFTFGDAGFFGSASGRVGRERVVAIQPSPSGAGYWLSEEHNTLHGFGDARVPSGRGDNFGRNQAAHIVDMGPSLFTGRAFARLTAYGSTDVCCSLFETGGRVVGFAVR